MYVVRTDEGKLRAFFRPVQTGLTGTTDIQVTSGLQPGDEVVTGKYKTLRNLASGTTVKRDTEVAGTNRQHPKSKSDTAREAARSRLAGEYGNGNPTADGERRQL